MSAWHRRSVNRESCDTAVNCVVCAGLQCVVGQQDVVNQDCRDSLEGDWKRSGSNFMVLTNDLLICSDFRLALFGSLVHDRSPSATTRFLHLRPAHQNAELF